MTGFHPQVVEYVLLGRYRVPGWINRRDGLWSALRRRDLISVRLRPARPASRPTRRTTP